MDKEKEQTDKKEENKSNVMIDLVSDRWNELSEDDSEENPSDSEEEEEQQPEITNEENKE